MNHLLPLLDRPTLLIVLAIIAIPLCIGIGKLFFDSWDDFLDSLRLPYQLQWLSAFRFARTTIGLALCAYGFAAHAKCLPYEPALVTLSGKLERKTFPGRPNYESVANGDEPETGFYLILTSPICTHSYTDSTYNEMHSNVLMVQLILKQQGYAKLQPFVGKNISIRGSLSGWLTAHHHTPLLLTFEGVRVVGNAK